MFVESTFPPETLKRQICTTLNELFLESGIHSPTKTRSVNQRLLHFPHADLCKVKSTNPPPSPVDVFRPRTNPTLTLALRATIRTNHARRRILKGGVTPVCSARWRFFSLRRLASFLFIWRHDSCLEVRRKPFRSHHSVPPCNRSTFFYANQSVREVFFLRIMQKKKIQRNEGCRLNPKKIDDELGQLVTWWSDTTPHPIDLVYSNSAD